MLKIDVIRETAMETRFSLAGTVSTDTLSELGRVLDEARTHGRRLVLDLGSVTLVDRDAVTFFAFGRGHDAILERCPRYLRQWIRREVEERSPAAARDVESLG